MAFPVIANSWVPYAQNDGLVRYYDKTRMVNISGTAFIWDMYDLKTPAADDAGNTYRSVLQPTEFSCRKQLRRVLSIHKMSGNMGAGSTVAEQIAVGEWVDVLPQSLDDQLMRAACESY